MAINKNLIGMLAVASGLLLALALVLSAYSMPAEALVATGANVLPKADAVEVGSGSRYLANGTYVLDVGKKTSLVVGVMRSSKKAGAKAIVQEDVGSKSQQWVLTWDDSYQAYRIKNANSGFYLTTKKAKAGKNLVSQAKLSASDKKQLWTLQVDGTGYKILSLANSSVGLGTANGKAEDGSSATVQKAKARKFTFYILPVDESLIKPTTPAPESLNGTFANISLVAKSSMVVGIESEDLSNGATASLLTESGSQSQKWYLKAVNAGQGIYTIVNLGSGKALQVARKGRHIGTDVVQGTVKASSKAQQWWVRTNSKGYTFTSCYNGLILRSKSKKQGANVCLAMKGASNRTFQFDSVEPLGAGLYQISSKEKTSLALNIASGSEKQNVQLQLSTRKKSSISERFSLTSLGGGEYAIRSVTSNRYIGVSGGKVVQGTRSPNASQRWKVAWAGSGFALKNVGAKSYLSVSGAAKKGAKLIAKSTPSALVFSKCHLIENGTYYFAQGSNSKRVIGLSQSKAKKNTAAVGIFKKSNVQRYKFTVTFVEVNKAGNEVYTIKNAYSGKYLTVSGGSVIQKKSTSSSSHNWEAVVTSTGMLAFKNVETGTAMSFTSKKVKAESYNSSGSAARFRWNLVATTTLTSAQLKAYEMLTSTFSRTNYAVTVDLSKHRFRVWKRKSASSPWVLRNDWICSNGAPGSPTPAVNVLSTGGKRRVAAEARSNGVPYNSSFYYLTYFAEGVFIHTPTYVKGSTTKIKDGRMGRSISGGCIRLQVPHAKWVFRNIKRGTRLISYY